MAARSGEDIRMENSLSFHSENPSWLSGGKRLVRVTKKKKMERIFTKINPERITLGTLRFEENFYNMRDSIFTTGCELPEMMNSMKPMFEPKMFKGKKRPKVGKYSFSEEARVKIFDFIIKEIRKYSGCHMALCKESAEVWNQLALDLSRVRCVCQLDYADMKNQ